MVALVRMLSSHGYTPLFWQLVGSEEPAPKSRLMREPSVSYMTARGRFVADGVTSAGAAKVGLPKSADPRIAFPLFTSSARAPEFLRTMPAVGTVFQSAAAASTMAVACWLVI